MSAKRLHLKDTNTRYMFTLYIIHAKDYLCTLIPPFQRKAKQADFNGKTFIKNKNIFQNG